MFWFLFFVIFFSFIFLFLTFILMIIKIFLGIIQMINDFYLINKTEVPYNDENRLE